MSTNELLKQIERARRELRVPTWAIDLLDALAEHLLRERNAELRRQMDVPMSMGHDEPAPPVHGTCPVCAARRAAETARKRRLRARA
jgi:hypothetical protein